MADELESGNYVPSPDMEGDQWFDLGCKEAKLGLKFNGVEITFVVAGGWAYRNGVEVDDEITEVNGRLFGPLPARKKVLALQGPRPLMLKFKRPAIKDTYYEVELDQKELGLGFSGVKVSSVLPNGWASVRGVEIDDEIAEVCGLGFSTLSDDEKLRLFKQPRPIILKFKRPFRGQILGSLMGGRGDRNMQSSSPMQPSSPQQNVYRLKRKDDPKTPRAVRDQLPGDAASNGATPRGLGSSDYGSPREFTAVKAPTLRSTKDVRKRESSWFQTCCGGGKDVSHDEEIFVLAGPGTSPY